MTYRYRDTSQNINNENQQCVKELLLHREGLFQECRG